MVKTSEPPKVNGIPCMWSGHNRKGCIRWATSAILMMDDYVLRIVRLSIGLKGANSYRQFFGGLKNAWHYCNWSLLLIIASIKPLVCCNKICESKQNFKMCITLASITYMAFVFQDTQIHNNNILDPIWENIKSSLNI